MTVVYGWKRFIGQCTHGVVLKNGGLAERETTYQFMQEYVSTRRLQLTVAFLDDEMAANLEIDLRGVFATGMALRRFGVPPEIIRPIFELAVPWPQLAGDGPARKRRRMH